MMNADKCSHGPLAAFVKDYGSPRGHIKRFLKKQNYDHCLSLPISEPGLKLLLPQSQVALRSRGLVPF